MAAVVREIHIDAHPDAVREHLTDPGRRSTWLDEGPIEVAPTRTGVTYTRGEGPDGARVDIEVLPEGEGSRVRVTEQVRQRQTPATPQAPEPRALWAVPAGSDLDDGSVPPDVIEPDDLDDARPDLDQAPWCMARAA